MVQPAGVQGWCRTSDRLGQGSGGVESLLTSELRATIELNRATGGASCTFAATAIMTHNAVRSDLALFLHDHFLARQQPIRQLDVEFSKTSRSVVGSEVETLQNT
jgi:hypothetical protein